VLGGWVPKAKWTCEKMVFTGFLYEFIGELGVHFA